MVIEDSAELQLQRFGGRRIVQTITGLEGLDEHENYRLTELFRYDFRAEQLRPTSAAGGYLS